MIFTQDIGIISYGAYIPSLVIPAAEIERGQGKVGSGIPQSLGVVQKTVPAKDEDTITLATAAAGQAVQRWEMGVAGNEAGAEAAVSGRSGGETIPKEKRQDIQALFIGSESHPYAVKPTGVTVKTALGLGKTMALADLQFACKAGTQAVQIAAAYAAAGMAKVALAIGADTAQSRPGDVLEFTAGAGAAAFLIGSAAKGAEAKSSKFENPLLVKILATTSIATDTPDFWRRPGQKYPEHAGRFSGEPAYFAHVSEASKLLLNETGLKPAEIDFCVFHTPNAKFPQAVAAQLGFTQEQLQHSLIVKKIGNTYAAASLLALAAVLDVAPAGAKILVTSYGSGAGADSFLFETTPALVEQRAAWQKNHLGAHMAGGSVLEQIARVQQISYQEYRKNTQLGHGG